MNVQGCCFEFLVQLIVSCLLVGLFDVLVAVAFVAAKYRFKTNRERTLYSYTFCLEKLRQIIVTIHFQIDLAQIRTEFEKKTGQSLKDVVVKKMKGDLEKLLLQLLGNWIQFFNPFTPNSRQR